MSDTAKYARSPGILVQQVSDQMILLNPNDGQYFALDDVGGQIWGLCDGSHTISEMANVLSNEYDASLNELASDVQELLNEFVQEKLVDAR